MARLLECTEDRQIIMIHIANKIHELKITGTENSNGIFIDLVNISMEQLIGITDFLKICVNYHQKRERLDTSRPIKKETNTKDPPKKENKQRQTTTRTNRKEKPVMSESAASLLKASLKSIRAKK